MLNSAYIQQHFIEFYNIMVNDFLDKYEKISNSINVYLDNVMVNTENQQLRKNRKSLLAECKIILSANFNFSQLNINE